MFKTNIELIILLLQSYCILHDLYYNSASVVNVTVVKLYIIFTTLFHLEQSVIPYIIIIYIQLSDYNLNFLDNQINSPDPIHSSILSYHKFGSTFLEDHK